MNDSEQKLYDMIGEDIQEQFNLNIVRELLKEIDPNIDDDTVFKVLTLCSGNPWCAKMVYVMLKD